MSSPWGVLWPANPKTHVMNNIGTYLIPLPSAIHSRWRQTSAGTAACFASYYESRLALTLNKIPYFSRAMELYGGDEHSIVRFLRKRIPCKCLDEKYKEAKSTTKMGICFNPGCSFHDGRVERKGMLYCTRCNDANYCSRECHVAHWPRHKKWCEQWAEKRAAFMGKDKSSNGAQQARARWNNDYIYVLNA